jgi:hypothetical protein
MINLSCNILINVIGEINKLSVKCFSFYGNNSMLPFSIVNNNSIDAESIVGNLCLGITQKGFRSLGSCLTEAT